MKNAIIVGTGNYALVAYHFLKKEGKYKIIAFSEERAFIRFQEIEGLPNIPFESLEEKAPVEETVLLIAVGPNKINSVRERLYLSAKEKGYSFITYISPDAYVWDTKAIGENSFIFPRCVVEPFAKVGNNSVLWSGTIIAHHSEVMDHCFLAPGACVSGQSVIGKNSFVGINSTVRDNVVVAERCIIGGGAVIKKNTVANGVYSAPGTSLLNKDSFNTNV